MKLKADGIELLQSSDGSIKLTLTVKDYNNKRLSQQIYQDLKECEHISVEMKKYRNTRSIQQNKLLWELLSQLAYAINGSRTSDDVMNIYCAMLEEANVESDFLLTREVSEESLKNQFRAIRKRGTRKVETDSGETIEMNVYQYWVGSSKFDTKQMNDLIDVVLKKCAEYDIYDNQVNELRKLANETKK